MNSTYKDTPCTLELIKKAQAGCSVSENKLILAYSRYVDFMVKRYSKKTEIKEDDDLRAYIHLGLLDGIRKFKPDRNTRFIYFAHIWMKKNIFLGEAVYRFIKIPVNQQVFYDNYSKTMDELSDMDEQLELLDEDIQRYMVVKNTHTNYFTDFAQYDEETGTHEVPEHLLFHLNTADFSSSEEHLSMDVLKKNISTVLSGFNEKEVYIIKHLYGLDGEEKMSSDEIAKNLNVTKVNITFTKTRVIRIMRHASLSEKLLEGV